MGQTSRNESIIVTDRRKTSNLTRESMTTSYIHSAAKSRCSSEVPSSVTPLVVLINEPDGDFWNCFRRQLCSLSKRLSRDNRANSSSLAGLLDPVMLILGCKMSKHLHYCTVESFEKIGAPKKSIKIGAPIKNSVKNLLKLVQQKIWKWSWNCLYLIFTAFSWHRRLWLSKEAWNTYRPSRFEITSCFTIFEISYVKTVEGNCGKFPAVFPFAPLEVLSRPRRPRRPFKTVMFHPTGHGPRSINSGQSPYQIFILIHIFPSNSLLFHAKNDILTLFSCTLATVAMDEVSCFEEFLFFKVQPVVAEDVHGHNLCSQALQRRTSVKILRSGTWRRHSPSADAKVVKTGYKPFITSNGHRFDNLS